MLVTAAILLTATGALVVLYAAQAYQMKQKLAAVAGVVREDIERKQQADLANDAALAQELIGTAPTSQAIDQWQADRAKILPIGRAGSACHWSDDDLQQYGREQLQGLSDAIRCRSLLVTVVGGVGVLLAAGIGAMIALHFHGAQADAAVPVSTVQSALDAFQPIVDPNP